MHKSDPKSPLCYFCKHRGAIPGDRHSICRHPANKPVLGGNSLITTIVMLGGRLTPEEAAKLGMPSVVGVSHAIKRGWFNWPVNYDPAWLISCDGYERKEDGDNQD